MEARRLISTLADFRDTHRAIRAYCSHYYACSHDAQLRLEILAHHLGWGFDFYGGRDYLAGRLRCSICGWNFPTFALGHAGERQGFAGTHGAGFVPLATEVIADMQARRVTAGNEEMPWVGKRKGGRKFGR
jgi:hypothetical protein